MPCCSFTLQVLKHLEPSVLEQTQRERLPEHLLTAPITGFSTAAGLAFMRELDASWPQDDDTFSL